MNHSIKLDITCSILFACFVVLGNLQFGFPVLAGVAAIFLGLVYFIKRGKINGSLINARGLFALSWMVSTGMSMLRIHPNQTVWTPITSLCIAIALPSIFAGYVLRCRSKKKRAIARHLKKADGPSNRLEAMYPICIVVILGLICDTIYSHELPVFSKSMSAYMDFGMPKVHYVTVFCCVVPALYFCLCKTAKVKLIENKLLFAFTIFCSIIPFLIVSRQLLLLELVLLVLSVLVFAHKEDTLKVSWIFAALSCCLVLWFLLSSFRNQSSAYLIEVFNLPHGLSNFQTSLWQLYLYIAFNFDNFNYLAGHLGSLSFGANAAFPILALSGTKGLVPAALLSSEGLRALPTYTTYPFIEPAFRDFGFFGVMLYSVAIGYFTAVVENAARTTADPVFHVIYYLTLYSLVISFFTSEFAQPVFWVYILLLLLTKLLNHRLIDVWEGFNRTRESS